MDLAGSGHVAVGHPIDVASGAFFTDATDMAIDGAVVLTVSRRYDTTFLSSTPLTAAAASAASGADPFGPGWRASFDASLEETLDGFVFRGPEGRSTRLRLPRDGAFERSGTVVCPRPSVELSRVDGRMVLARFGLDRDPLAYVFEPRGAGAFALAWIQRTPSARLVHARDARGRVASIAQTRERRRVDVTWDEDRVVALDLALPGGGRRAVARYRYDDAGRLVARSDADGVLATYVYDGAHRLIREEHRDGSIYGMRYDARGRCHHVSGVGGYQERTLRWADAAKRTTVTDSHGAATIYDFNDEGQVVRVTHPTGSVESFEFDADGRPTRSHAPDGGVTERTYDALGRTSRVVRPDGSARAYTHDAQHRMVAVTDELGRTTRLERGPHHEIARVVRDDGSAWTYTHSEHGELLRVTNPMGASRSIGRDALGNPARETDWAGAMWTSTHDELGQLVSRTSPLGTAQRYVYDARDAWVGVEGPDGRSWRRETNDASGVTTVVRRDGRITRTSRSPCGQPLAVSDADGFTTHYAWDTEPWRLTSICDPAGATYRFEHDAAGNVVRMATFDGRRFAYEWDRDRMVSLTDPAGRRVAFERDARGRAVLRSSPEGDTEYEYDAAGRLVRVEGEGSRLTFRYDARGACVEEVQNGVTVRREHDALGRVTHLASLDGKDARFTYDANGRCASVEAGGARVSIERDAMGREVRRDIPGYGVLHQAFDARGALAAQSFRHARDPAAPVAWRTYAYDAEGSPSAVRDGLRGATELRYDGRDNLVAVVRPGGASEVYAYDACSNRTHDCLVDDGAAVLEAADSADVTDLSAIAMRAGPATVRTYGKGNRLERVTTLGSSIAYEYDASGCVVRKTTTTARDERTLRLQWNSRRQLVAAILPDGERWEYAYDGLGRRLRKQSSSGDVVRYVWDGFRVLHEIQNGVCRSWTYLPRSAVPVLAEDGVTRAVLVDRVGAPSELVGPAGIDRVLRKGTWGEAMPGGDDAPDQPFMGQWRDEETGLHYNVFRYYDPDAGRYLSPDPIELEGGTNAYAFVPSPFGWVDPLGLAAKKCAGPTDEQVEHAVENIDGLTPDQARKLMEASFKRDSTIVFGGSRVRGDAHEGSDLDVGFGSLSASQASKILGNEDLNTPLSLEQTRIVPGNKPPRIDPAIDTPEGFFARSGNRTDPGREGEPFSPSGSITYGPDGSITDNRIK